MTDGALWGPIEVKVRSDIEALISEHPMGESLAEMAFGLARRLDGSVKNADAAAVNKELRETLCVLAGKAGADSDDLSDALSVPTSLRDA